MSALARHFNKIYSHSYERHPLLTIAVTNSALAACSDIIAQRCVQDDRDRGYDVARTGRFALFGFGIAPILGKWYEFLEKRFPLGKAVAGATLRRVCADQILWAPVGLALFFTYMPLAEGKGFVGVRERFADAYLPGLQANYTVWPLVQFINFRFMPLRYRVPFVSGVSVFWNAYLSWLNNKARVSEKADARL
ncbi:uncharacterized protein VTP21DRAFT_6194 [Calcarisporiella thermophila]|uniref:uncharacterized protein n=1 Tax=Calcarisporiella thermophila TaxID=911321 RepID=UPI003743BE6A